VDSKTKQSDEIIKMARDAGLHLATEVNWMPIIGLEYAEKFAALVAAHEREECAKACEDSDTWDLYDPNGFAANLIRAREEK
jgi:hypothetical protein